MSDADGNQIESGDKVKTNSSITVTAVPDESYVLVAVTLNGERIEGTEFSVVRASEVSALFTILGGVDSIDLDGVVIRGNSQEILVAIPEESRVEVYNLLGVNLFTDFVDGEIRVSVASGIYVVRVTNGQGMMVKVISVR